MVKLALLAVLTLVASVRCAIIKSQEIDITRASRSPCPVCGEPSQNIDVHPQSPPSTIVQTQNWNGLASSANGLHAVFSGAAAATDQGLQTTGEAFSLASSAVDTQKYVENIPIFNKSDSVREDVKGNENRTYISGSLGNVPSYKRGNLKDFNGNIQYASDQPIQYNSTTATSDSQVVNYNKHVTYEPTHFKLSKVHSSIENNTNTNSQNNNEAPNMFKHSDATDLSSNEHTRLNGELPNERKLVSYNRDENGETRNDEEGLEYSTNIKYGSPFAHTHLNRNEPNDDYSKFGISGNKYSNNKNTASQTYKSSASSTDTHETKDKNKETKYDNQSLKTGDLDNISLNGPKNSEDDINGDKADFLIQSALDGALRLTSQGLQAANGQQSECSKCSKNGFAFSNAKSNSGAAIALSIGG